MHAAVRCRWGWVSSEVESTRRETRAPGVTGPTPTATNLGADLRSGMEALPVNFDIQFIPLDGEPSLPEVKNEVIFQNTGWSTFSPVPEPSSLLITGVGSVFLLGIVIGRQRLRSVA
jgi:hypothetical protein